MLPKYLEKYKDVQLFLIAIPVISTINYHLTYANPRLDWYTFTTFFIDIFTGYVAWWLARLVILYLDRKVPYEKAIVKRILLQVVLTNIVAQGFIIFETETVNALFNDKPLPLSFYTYNLFIFFIWILVINGYYTGVYLFDQWKNTQQLREQEKQLETNGFEVLIGKINKLISFNAIASFYAQDKSTFLVTKEGKQFVLDSSLSKVMANLPNQYFFRLNRKFIVHRDQIQAYRKEVNGKIAVDFLMGDTIQTSIVSRTNAATFKNWAAATLTKV